jgi:hypothetical protein
MLWYSPRQRARLAGFDQRVNGLHFIGHLLAEGADVDVLLSDVAGRGALICGLRW